MVYRVLFIAAFLYDRYIASCRPVLVALRHACRDIWQEMGRVSDVRLAMRSVIIRYKLGWIYRRFYYAGACLYV